jgi:hypothetical protein
MAKLFAEHTAALFEALQIGQQIVNLVRVKLECRHCRMTGLNAFGHCLAEGLYPVTQMQRS